MDSNPIRGCYFLFLAFTLYTLHPSPKIHHKSVKNVVFTLFPCSVRKFFVPLCPQCARELCTEY